MQEQKKPLPLSNNVATKTKVKQEDMLGSEEIVSSVSDSGAKSGEEKKDSAPGKRFNRRELDFSADAGDYVVVYPAKDEPSEGYRFWVARAQKAVSYEINNKKKAVVIYYTAKGNTYYLDFEQESTRKTKIHFAMLMEKIEKCSLNQISNT